MNCEVKYDLTNKEDINTFREAIKTRYKILVGTDDGMEDCVQEILMKFFTNGVGQTIHQAVIDFLRKSSGKKGSKYYKAKNFVSIETIKEELITVDYNEENMDYYLNMVKPGLHKCLVNLHYKYGYSKKEIGQILGYSVVTISSMFGDIYDSLLNGIKGKRI